MIRTRSELADALEGTPLQGAEMVELPVPLHDESAFVVRLGGVDYRSAWRACRDRVELTGRWPVVSVPWAGDGHESWAREIEEERFFAREPFRNEAGLPSSRDVSPRGLVEAARTADVDTALDRLTDRSLYGRTLDEAVDEELVDLRERAGRAPERSELPPVESLGAFRRALLRWEAANTKPSWWQRLGGDRYLQDPGSFLGKAGVMLLLPTVNDWESLAHHHFWGANRIGTEAAVALLERWHQRHGAELVAHLGTMLGFAVARPPATLEEALEPAWEQATFAECTTVLPNVSTLHHARILVGRTSWILHERP